LAIAYISYKIYVFRTRWCKDTKKCSFTAVSFLLGDRNKKGPRTSAALPNDEKYVKVV
jgi:hypothetical protein